MASAIPGLLLVLVSVWAQAPACSCSCCEVARPDLGLRCTREPGQCTETCLAGPQPLALARVDDGDAGLRENRTAAAAAGQALVSALRGSLEVDVERYCWEHCVPQPDCQAGTPSNAPPPPPKAPLLRKNVTGSLLRRADATSRTEPHLEDHNSISIRAEDSAKSAAARLTLATKSAALTLSVKNEAKGNEGFVSDEVVEAKKAAGRSALDLRAGRSITNMAWDAAQTSAADVKEATLKAMEKEAHDLAKVEAEKVGAELEKKMKDAAPAAGIKAMAPYTDAMNKAAAAAGSWAKAGDGAGGLSFQLGMQASMLMSEANQWNAVGQFAKAQGMMRTSLDLSNQANGLAGASQNAYDQAAKIVSTLGGYVGMAGQAQYHAQYMLDPDMYPPVAFGR